MRYKQIKILIIFFTLLISCEKEKITEIEKEIEVEKQYSWKINESFLFNEKIQMNSYADSSKFYTIGRNTFSTIRPIEHNSVSLATEHALLRFEYPIDYKMPITSKVFVGVRSSFVGFYSSQNPVHDQSSFRISMTNVDPTFANFNMPRAFVGEGIVMNDNLQCLIPYQQYDTTYKDHKVTSAKPNFLLVNLRINGENSGYIDTVSTNLFTVDENAGPLYSLHSFEDYFFITCSEKTFKLSSNNELKDVFNGRLYKLIKKDNIIYGFTDDAKLFSSTDKGNSWQSMSNVDPNMWRINYTIIDNEIIGYHKSQIFHINIQPNRIDIQEILNDGLYGNEITSISHFLDKIYVTTLSGVFNKDLTDFFTYMTEE